MVGNRFGRTRASVACGVLALAATVVPVSVAAPALAAPTAADGGYVGVTPFRLLDTREIGRAHV